MQQIYLRIKISPTQAKQQKCRQKNVSFHKKLLSKEFILIFTTIGKENTTCQHLSVKGDKKKSAFQLSPIPFSFLLSFIASIINLTHFAAIGSNFVHILALLLLNFNS
jgi:hypothetical protein